MYYDQKESGMRIKNLRQEHGYTQEAFANRLNITVEHLCRIEMGKRGCSVDLMIELVFCFDVSLDYLVLGRKPVPKEVNETIKNVIAELQKLDSFSN